jgi:hypothetical protein
MAKKTFLVLLMGAALWLCSGLIRAALVPGLASLEKQIWQDWEEMKAVVPELVEVQELHVYPSEEGGVANVWANEVRLNCLKNPTGNLGAELLLVPVETDQGLAATVQIYIYELMSGEFVKEVSRLYPLSSMQ